MMRASESGTMETVREKQEDGVCLKKLLNIWRFAFFTYCSFACWYDSSIQLDFDQIMDYMELSKMLQIMLDKGKSM